MSAKIPTADLTKAASVFALPQIAIVKPRLVVCLGLVTFTAARLACGHPAPPNMNTAIESPFEYGDSLIHCQSHTGHFGRVNRNKGGVDRVSQAWVRMKERAGL
jgi:restriction system protein